MRGVMLAALPLLVGCAAETRPVTIGDALHTLQQQLQAAGAINAAAATPARFAEAAREAQCDAHDADPEVPVLAHDITIDLTGSFTANGGFAVGPAITGGPPFGFSGALTRAQTQGLTLPITFTALAALPHMVAAQRGGLFAGLPAGPRAAELRRVLAERDTLRRRIHGLIASFAPRLCAGRRAAGPWQPMTAPAPASPGR